MMISCTMFILCIMQGFVWYMELQYGTWNIQTFPIRCLSCGQISMVKEFCRLAFVTQKDILQINMLLCFEKIYNVICNCKKEDYNPKQTTTALFTSTSLFIVTLYLVTLQSSFLQLYFKQQRLITLIVCQVCQW